MRSATSSVSARVCYFVPGPMSRGPMGSAEVARRLDLLRRHAPADVAVELRETDGGPSSIESRDDEALAVEAMGQALPSLAAAGFDAVILGCFGDPGIGRVRAAVEAPVIGPAEASFSATTGRFAVLTIDEGVVPLIEALAGRYDCVDRLAAVASIDIPVLELRQRREEVGERLRTAGRSALEAGASALVLGCMTLGFLDVAAEVEAELGAPVVNPAIAALTAAVESARGRLAPA